MFDEIAKSIWERFREEWATVRSAPFAIVLVALIGALCGYELSEKLVASEVEGIKAQLGAKDGLIGQKDQEISSLRFKVEHPNQLPTSDKISIDPDGIYQLGKEVGRVEEARITLSNSSVSFNVVRSDGNFDKTKEFAYRNFVLKIKSQGSDTDLSFGGEHKVAIFGVVAEIIRRE